MVGAVQIVTTPPPDRRLIVAAVRFQTPRSMMWLRVLGPLLVALTLIDWFVSGSLRASGLVAGVVFAVLPWLVVGRVVARCWQLYGTPGTYTISDWGVQRWNGLTQHSYAWAALQGIREIPGQLIFVVDRAGFMPMSMAALLPGEREQILGTAARNGVRLG